MRDWITKSMLKMLRYVWAWPTSILGLAFLYPTIITGGRVRVVDGVLEIHGGIARFFLENCTLLPGGASAMTLGHVVLGRDESALDWTRDHERIHVRQCERWGPLFLPAYGISSALAKMRGKNP